MVSKIRQSESTPPRKARVKAIAVEAAFLLVTPVGVLVDRSKTGDIFPERFQHLANVAHHMRVLLAGQVRSLADVRQAVGAAARGDFGKSRNADIGAIAKPLYEGTLDVGGNSVAGIVCSDDQLRSCRKRRSTVR